MDGLSRAIGASCPVTLQGKTYLLAPITLGVLGACEAFILSKRHGPFDDLARMTQQGRLTQQQADKMRNLAIAEAKRNKLLRIVTLDDMQNYTQSEEGLSLTGWLGLREHHPQRFEFQEDFIELFGKCSDAEQFSFVKIQAQISGMDMLASLDWGDSLERDLGKERVIDGRVRYLPIPWRQQFRNLADARYWSKLDWERLTMYEYRTMIDKEQHLGGYRKMSGVEVGNVSKTGQRIIRIGNDGKGLAELKRVRAEHEKKMREKQGGE